MTTVSTTHRFSAPKVLLHLEGLALFVGALAFYAYTGGNPWLFALLLLAPDLSMVGYLRNVQLGSFMYNSVHNTVLPTLLGLVALATGWGLGVQLALIWLAHIGMDRTVGYGLKYATTFRDTHLNRV